MHLYCPIRTLHVHDVLNKFTDVTRASIISEVRWSSIVISETIRLYGWAGICHVILLLNVIQIQYFLFIRFFFALTKKYQSLCVFGPISLYFVKWNIFETLRKIHRETLIGLKGDFNLMKLFCIADVINVTE